MLAFELVGEFTGMLCRVSQQIIEDCILHGEGDGVEGSPVMLD